MLLKLTKKFRDLQSLEISHTRNLFGVRYQSEYIVAGGQIVEAIRELSDLRSLKLPDDINGSQLIEITTMQPNIQNLNLDGWEDQISGSELLKALGKLSNLRKLNISNFDNLSGDQLVEIAKSLPLLEFLDIRDCDQIQKDKLDEALLHLPKIKKYLAQVNNG